MVSCHYPLEFANYNESALSSYMIPDGVHKLLYDISIFKFKVYSKPADLIEKNYSLNL